jgi:hypothetical protein|nr:MAG TPA: hypothetical protein [Caudoviricetes sp.]
MFAKSEKITAVGGEHIPLFAKQTPLPVTVSAKATENVSQYQVCILKNDGTVSAVTGLTNISPLSNTQQLCIAAFAAKSNEPVSVYTHGTFNINALTYGPEFFSTSENTPAEKLEKLRKFNSSVIFFEHLDTNPVQRT